MADGRNVTAPDPRALAAGSVALAVLAAASLALPFAQQGPSHGVVLAAVKLIAIAFVFVRLRRRDVYALQWSSMGVLLFVAEGAVRATTDPPRAAALGAMTLLAGAAYFVAVLLYLRPLKKRARAERDAVTDATRPVVATPRDGR